MLGYTQALRTAYGSTYGIAHGIIWLSEVNCIGNETNIAQCSFPGWGINNCYHYRDVNVICDSESWALGLRNDGQYYNDERGIYL